jgi:hypothetical protein
MILFKIFLLCALLSVFGSCITDDPSQEQLELQNEAGQEMPVITIINESAIDITISYMPDEDITVEAVILSGTEYEVESGVTEIFIDGGSLLF